MIFYTILEILIFTLPFFILNNLFSKNVEKVFKILIFLSIVYILKSIFEYIYKKLLIKIVENYRQNLIINIIEKIKNSRIDNYIENQERYISWIKNDVDRITQFKCHNFYEMIRNSLFLISSYTILFYLSKTIFIVNVIGLVIVHYISESKIALSSEIYGKLSMVQEKYFSKISNLFSCLSLFYYSNKDENFIEKFSNLNEEYEKGITKNFYKLNNTYFFITFSSILLQIISILMVNIYVILEYLKIGSIQIVPAIIGNSTNQIVLILQLYMEYNSVGNIFEKFLDIKYLENENLEKIRRIESIRFENVSLEFNNKKILDNFNYEFFNSKKYLIIGESGTGKSSLIKILLGEITTYTGNIYINNINLNKIDKKSLFDNLTYIDASNFVFNYDMYDNISLFNDYDKEKIDEILDYINLEQRSNSINEHSLSTGQKQRLNLARIIYNKKKVLILDEATSNIDNNNFEKILNKILEKENLVILISHNISNYNDFDEVLDFNDKCKEKLKLFKGENIL